MSKSQLNAFVAKMESDPSLKALVASAASPEAVVAIASDNGNSFIGKGFEEPFSQSGFSGTEIIAVPETETYIAATLLLAGYGIFHLRRRAKRNTTFVNI